MDTLVYSLSLIGGIATVIALIPLSLLDIRSRNIPDKYILLYLLAASPTLALYFLGLPYTYLIISLAMCMIWIGIRKTGAWGGGDAKFLMVFSLCCPLNPLNLYQQAFQIQFVIILGAVMLIAAIFTRNRKDLPLMLPISAAIILAMVTGVFL